MIITIDGNIGAGKSTLLEFLKKNGGYDIHLEPVSDWEPFLEEMYQHDKDAFEFQVKVWTDRCFSPSYASNKITCVERSPHFQWYVFSMANFYGKKLNTTHMKLLASLYAKPCYTPDLYIYLASDPDECVERISKRNRKCEQGISKEYIHQLHNLHEFAYTWLNTPDKVWVNIQNKTQDMVANEVLAIIQKYTKEHREILAEHL